MEIEAKFKAPEAGVLDALASSPDVAGFDASRGRVQDVVDIYLDTEDWRILAGGFSCRLRLDGTGVLVTVKQLQEPGGAVHRRQELEIRLPEYREPASWPDSPARDKVLELTSGHPLREMLELRQTRTTRLLGASDRPVAEMSLDVVRLSAADGDGGVGDGDGSPVNDGQEGHESAPALTAEQVYYEVEVELCEGGAEQDLERIVTALRNSWALEPEPLSKFHRALGLSRATRGGKALPEDATTAPFEGAAIAPSGEAATAAAAGTPESASAEEGCTRQPAAETRPKGKRQRKESFLGDGLEVLEKPGLTADDTMAESCRKTLLYHLQRMMRHEPGTRAGEDPEELHDMRVATRRMRAALRVFADYVDKDGYRPFLKAMRQTGRELGAVRDLDVFMIKTQAYIDSLPPEARSGLDPLVEAWHAERDRVRAELLGYLDSERYQRFKERFEAFLRTPGAGDGRALGSDGEPLPVRVGDVLPAVVFDRLAHVKAFDGPISRPDAPLSVFHQLRITSKGLRYTLEFFQEVLGPESKPLIDRTKQVQDHLGDLQDAVVTCDVLLGFLGSGTWGVPRGDKRGPRTPFPVNAPGVAAYLAVKQDEVERLMHTFGPVWDPVRGSDFSRPLTDLVAAL